MSFILRNIRRIGNWIHLKMFIRLRRNTPVSYAEKANILYRETTLSGYELTDEQMRGSRAVRKMPSFNVEPEPNLIYGEGHHGT